MKQIKLILILSIVYCLLSIVYCYAAGEDVTVSGDSKAQTVSLEDAALPASGSEGEIRYNTTDDKLYVWDGTGWKLLSANKNVATKIVGVRRNPPNTALDSLDADRADYICNGVSDQQEINQAINEVANATINPTQQGVVYLLDGTYNISAALLDGMTTAGIVLKSGISLIGAGNGTVLKLTSGTSNVNVINASSVNRILISQLMIDGNSKTGSNNNGIKFTLVTYSKIAQIWVENMSLYGISFDAGNTDNTLSDNIVQSNGFTGIFLSSSRRNIVSSNTVQSNGLYGIYLSDNCDNNILSGNNVQFNASGISLGLSDNNILSGNNVQLNSAGGIGLVTSLYNTITGNNIQSNSGGFGGIFLSASNYNTITGNNIQNNPYGILFSTVFYNVVTGNTIFDNQIDAIRLTVGCSYNLFSTNRISKSGAQTIYCGIDIDNGTGNYLVANYIDGTGFADKINDAGTNTKYTGKEKLTLEQVTDTTSASIDSNQSYVKLGAAFTTGSYAVATGKSAGDILILEGPSSGTAVPTVANLKLCTNSAHIIGSDSHPLSANDTLTLIWNATASAWLELSYTNN